MSIRQQDVWLLHLEYNTDDGFIPYPVPFRTRRDAELIGRMLAEEFGPDDDFEWSVSKQLVHESFHGQPTGWPETVLVSIRMELGL